MLNINSSDGKNIVLIIVRDSSGCSHVRLRYNAHFYAGFDHLGFIPVISPIPVFDGSWLARVKAIVFQRAISTSDVDLVKRYKAIQPKFGYKMVFEVDDQVFNINGKCVPEYNTASLHFDGNATTKACEEVLPLMDEVVVSTDYLKMKMEEIFKIKNVSVIPNVVPRFLWSYPRKKNITENLTKPKILYSGSPCHYRNPVPARQPSPQEPNGFPGLSPLKGDMDNAWCDWIIKNVKADKIDFVIMGALPWFWEEIKDKITFIPWEDSHTYPRRVMEQKADFSLGMIVDNEFNRCKSSLRHIESCSAGMVFLGTVFRNNKWSPYEEINDSCKVYDDFTVDQIDEVFWKLCEKDKYNEVLNWQYNFINKNNFWLESTRHTNLWLEMLDGKPGENFI